jgi:uncharacterized phage-associated protein
MNPNEKKLKNIILYILGTYNNSKLTETKLQKLLYFCDFDHFEKYGKSITGYTYYKNHFGPTIKSLPSIMGELEKDGYIAIIRQNNYYGTQQTNFSLMKLVDTDFDDSEKLIIDRVNNAYASLTSRQISTLSHRDPPYVVAKDRERLDYESVIYRADEDEEEDIDEEAQKYFEDIGLDTLLLANKHINYHGTK